MEKTFHFGPPLESKLLPISKVYSRSLFQMSSAGLLSHISGGYYGMLEPMTDRAMWEHYCGRVCWLNSTPLCNMIILLLPLSWRYRIVWWTCTPFPCTIQGVIRYSNQCWSSLVGWPNLRTNLCIAGLSTSLLPWAGRHLLYVMTTVVLTLVIA